MKLNSNKKFSRLILTLILVLAIGGALFFIDFQRPNTSFANFFSLIGKKITKPVANLAKYKITIEENKKLTKENQKLKAKLAQMGEIKRENEKLRKELNIKTTKDKEKIIANIIGRSSDPRGRVALVNKGENQGVKQGDIVTLAEGILFGKIVTTFKNYSKVAPITNASISVAARQQENRIEGVLRGRGSAKKPVFDLMSPDKELKKGPILTSGLDQKFLPGLLIGELSKIKFYPQESSKRGILEVPYTFNQVESVFIIPQ